MKKQNRKKFYFGVALLTAFIIWTVLIGLVDVKPQGAQKTNVGFAMVNLFFKELIGVNFSLYTITDWLSLVPLGIIFFFALVGVVQLIKRKSLLKVDYSILLLGGFYAVVMAVYMFFEIFFVNYRPVLINGNLESSYPSSTTMLVLTVMPTAIIDLKARIRVKFIKRFITVIFSVFTVLMVTGRFLSGVHWFSDIIGGILLSVGMVLIYSYYFEKMVENKNSV